MRKLVRSTTLIVTLLAMITLTISCDFLTGDIVEADLYGTWNIDEASAKLRVAGVDITQVLQLTFGYTGGEATALADSIAGDLLQAFAGSFTFNDDYTFEKALTGLALVSGTWELEVDGNDLSLTEGDKTDIYQIRSLDATSLTLEVPADEIDMDLNKDGTDETTVQVSIELVLSPVE